MKGLIKLWLVLFAVLVSVHSVYGWDAKGHSVIGHIADRHLTAKACKMRDKYLGHTLAYYASWMDQVRYVDAYHHTARWHSVGVKDGALMPSDLTGSKAFYGTKMKNDDYGVAQVERIIEEMKNYKNLPDSVVVVNLKCLIHLVGDLHCPGHTFFADEPQQYYLKMGKRRLHFHNYHDAAFSRFNKGYDAVKFCDRYCRLTKAEKSALCEGDMEQWLRTNMPLYRECYKLLPAATDYFDLPDENKFRLKEISDNLHITAGYRLAHIVNEIFK